MNIKQMSGAVFFGVFLCFGTGQAAVSGDQSEDIRIADQKIIFEKYDEAKEIYQKIIRTSESPVVAAYAHYRLGSLYKRRNEVSKARTEYKKGILSLKKSDMADHQIGKYLTQAIKTTG